MHAHSPSTLPSPLPSPLALKSRADAIRLPVKELAEAAGLDENTVGRVLRGKAGRVYSLEQLDRALKAEEARLFDYLGGIVAPQKQAAE